MSRVLLDTKLIPKVRRLKIGRKYLMIGQPNVRVPLSWDFEQHLLFAKFIGFWLGKGYYEKHSVVIAAGNNIRELIDSFDWIGDTFCCNYKICTNKLVKFDSSILKYSMLGLGFNTGKKTEKQIPKWIIEAEGTTLNEILSGFLIANAKMEKSGINCDANNINFAQCIYTILLKMCNINMIKLKGKNILIEPAEARYLMGHINA